MSLMLSLAHLGGRRTKILGNKDKNEDDYSEATVIVSVKTGAIIGART